MRRAKLDSVVKPYLKALTRLFTVFTYAPAIRGINVSTLDFCGLLVGDDMILYIRLALSLVSSSLCVSPPNIE